VINIEIPLIIELVHELCCWLSGGARTVLPINSTAPRPLSLRASLASSNVQKPKLRSFVGSPAPSQCRLCVRSRSAHAGKRKKTRFGNANCDLKLGETHRESTRIAATHVASEAKKSSWEHGDVVRFGKERGRAAEGGVPFGGPGLSIHHEVKIAHCPKLLEKCCDVRLARLWAGAERGRDEYGARHTSTWGRRKEVYLNLPPLTHPHAARCLLMPKSQARRSRHGISAPQRPAPEVCQKCAGDDCAAC
jgi:hypothetical protein